MYSEEVDLCRRLKQAGWRVIYVPEALVVHYEARSSDQVAAARHIYFNRSKVRYYEIYFGPRWANRLRRYLLWEFRWQLWIERAKWLVGHKRSLRAQRIAAYRAVIATGLRNPSDTLSGTPPSNAEG
jgi:GT2 family glycosyltransferase